MLVAGTAAAAPVRGASAPAKLRATAAVRVDVRGVLVADVPAAASEAAASGAAASGAAASGAAAVPATERFGDARRAVGPPLHGRAVAMTRTPDGRGYWVLNAAGRVVAHGDARSYGDLSRTRLGSPAVAMASTPSGHGYWLATAAGNVWSFGDAERHGSLRDRVPSAPIVGMAPAREGAGYYLAASDGRVYAFGRAYGARSATAAAGSFVAIAATADDLGYWLVRADGGVSTYGDAGWHGSLPARGIATRTVVAIAATPSGQGYWLTQADGAVHAFGRTEVHGSSAPDPADRRTVALTSDSDGRGYWELSTYVRPPPPPPPPPAPPAGPSGRLLGTFGVTCYTGSGITASGAPTGMTDVAVDPSVIPLGSTIDISGVGVRVAQDTGSAIIGDRLDIWEPTEQGCINWGYRDEQVWLQS